jgi:hypothetical protein
VQGREGDRFRLFHYTFSQRLNFEGFGIKIYGVAVEDLSQPEAPAKFDLGGDDACPVCWLVAWQHGGLHCVWE